MAGVILACIGLFVVFIVSMSVASMRQAHGRDLDGRYAQSELQSWFNSLKSAKGLCCSLADGYSIQNADWTVEGQRYRVRVEGQWIDVPDDALVTVPNRFGSPVVWPIKDANGVITIRCFMAGALT